MRKWRGEEGVMEGRRHGGGVWGGKQGRCQSRLQDVES